MITNGTFPNLANFYNDCMLPLVDFLIFIVRRYYVFIQLTTILCNKGRKKIG